MTFNAASRLRSLEDRSAALGSSRCELPGMHSVPKSAVLPYASGVGGLSRRLLNNGKIAYNRALHILLHTTESFTPSEKGHKVGPGTGDSIYIYIYVHVYVSLYICIHRHIWL